MKKLAFLFVGVLFIAGVFSFGAPSVKALTTDELTAQIKLIQKQINELQTQLRSIQISPTPIPTPIPGPIPIPNPTLPPLLPVPLPPTYPTPPPGPPGPPTGPPTPAPVPDPGCRIFTQNLRFGMSGSEVADLQIVLQRAGFAAGDESNESGAQYFGEKTASAVVGFQQKYASEILTPLGLQYGTGFVGAATRTKLNALYGCNVVRPPVSPPGPPPTPCPYPLPGPTPTPGGTGGGGSSLPLPVLPSPTPPSTETAPPLLLPCPLPPIIAPPLIFSISPMSGPIGTKVTIVGSNFVSEGNTVRFGSGYIKNLKQTTGKTLEFVVPDGLDLCSPTATICPLGYPMVTPGNYLISVSNLNGTSNSVTFTVIGKLTPTPLPPITSVGDVTGDGKVDIGDALFIAQYVVGIRTLTPAQLKQADVNQDGQVSTNDTKIIAMYSIGADNVKSLPVSLRVGDANLDGNVSAADPLFIAQHLAGIRTLTKTQIAAADVNNDDRVTQADADTIANYLAGKVQKLPFPSAPLSTVQPSITVLSPNGGEVWQKGITQTIRWTTSTIEAGSSLATIANVNIELVTWATPCDVKTQICPLSPVFLFPIAKNISNSGVFNWTLPTTLPDGKYLIHVSNSANSDQFDESDNYFSIVSE